MHLHHTSGTYRNAPLVFLVFIVVSAAGATPLQEAQEVSLTLGDYRFQPQTIEVQSGRPVKLTLINIDSITPHNFSLQDGTTGLGIDADVGAGETVVIELPPVKTGSYAFHCNKKLPFMKSHRERGMEGTLRVKEAKP